MLLQFLKVVIWFIRKMINITICAYCQIFFYCSQDLHPEKTPSELLEDALKEPVHKEEPSVIKFLVYLHAFEPDFKDMDLFQV